MQKYYAIKTKNGKYASIHYDEFFIEVRESRTLNHQNSVEIYKSKKDALKVLIALNQNDKSIYYDDGVYLTDVVEVHVNLEIKEV